MNRQTDEYKRAMSYPMTFDVYARTQNYEEYSMRIVAKTDEQAQAAAEQLCQSLGLVLMACVEADESMATNCTSRREQFEKWVSGPPYAMSVERYSQDQAWNGMYKDIKTDLAWRAWTQGCHRKACVEGP